MFNKLFFLVIVLWLFAFSEVQAQTLLKEDKIPKDLSITLERTVCYGTCPDYKLNIQSDGTVNFEGRQYTKTQGKAAGKITSAQLKQIISEFEKAKFFSLKEKYPDGKNSCPIVATDMPSVVLSIKIDGKEKMIKHYLGCFKNSEPPFEIFPSELFDLENKIDEIVETKRWIGERK
ncbi:MAG: DUF6438 domain-containing protein [Pyrinomonadaceae bacterium]